MANLLHDLGRIGGDNSWMMQILNRDLVDGVSNPN